MFKPCDQCHRKVDHVLNRLSEPEVLKDIETVIYLTDTDKQFQVKIAEHEMTYLQEIFKESFLEQVCKEEAEQIAKSDFDDVIFRCPNCYKYGVMVDAKALKNK